VLPKGTKLVGYVARASSRAKGDTESALSLTFERAVLSNGQELPLNLSIQALASAQSVVSAGGSEMDAIPDSGAGVGSSSAARGRGLIGDATSETGATVGAATNTAGRAEGVGGSALIQL